jgi:hypothetical protein
VWLSGRNGAGEAGLEIEKADPFRRDGDADHLGNHSAELVDPSLTLLRAKVPLSGGGVLGDDAVDGLEMGGAADHKDLMREGIVVDGEGDFGIFLQGLELGCFGRGGEDEFTPVPVEPDGDDARRAVGPDVGEAGGDFGLEELFGGRLLEEVEAALFNGHR